MSHKNNNFIIGTAGDSLLERVPENILDEILSKFETETEILMTRCTLKCVSKTLNYSINQHFSSLSSIDLSAFSLDSEAYNGIRKSLGNNIKKLKLDCLRLNDLDDSSNRHFLHHYIKKVVLLKASSLSYYIIDDIAVLCPNLRVLTLELSDQNTRAFDFHLRRLLRDCRCLESLEINFHMEITSRGNQLLTNPKCHHKLPQTLKVLKFDMRVLAMAPITFGPTLTHLSLVLHVVTDVIVQTIARSCRLLVELELIDVPTSKPKWEDELSDQGLLSLVACKHLTSLSLIRSQQRLIDTFFIRTTDMGMISLSQGCKGLESVRLHGFSLVSGAGIASIVNSCLNLKKFDIRNVSCYKDLPFKDVSKAHRPLVDIKLVSCNSITCKGVRELVTSSCNSLEVLDLFKCKRVADSCLSDVSCLTLLTSLNLGGTNVTDAVMAVLGKANAPISFLSLRGCKRVTDEGIIFLLGTQGKLSKTLSSLDLGHVQKITDNVITVIAEACAGLIELCIRNCFMVTDEAMNTLSSRARLQPESKLLRRLDIFNCPGVSEESFVLLRKPLFRGLQWIGIGETRLIRVGDVGLGEIYKERPWLTICKDGCEVGCRDGWKKY